MNKYAAGIRNIDSNGAVIIPPTMGAAIRRMPSDPVPLPHMIGNRPAMRGSVRVPRTSFSSLTRQLVKRWMLRSIVVLQPTLLRAVRRAGRSQ